VYCLLGTVLHINKQQDRVSFLAGAKAMNRVEAEATPAEDWLQSLNATCNRLSTQYLNLLRAASSVSALEEGRQHDPRCKLL